MDTLGDAYSYAALAAVLAGSQKHRPKTKPIQQDELISKAIDAQRMEAKGKGYAYWAKNFNSKQYAKSILFLTENHLSIDDLPHAVEEACTKADALTAELKKGAVSKWLKQAMRGSAFFRNIFGQMKTECRKNGTQGIIFIRNSKWNEL